MKYLSVFIIVFSSLSINAQKIDLRNCGGIGASDSNSLRIDSASVDSHIDRYKIDLLDSNGNVVSGGTIYDFKPDYRRLSIISSDGFLDIDTIVWDSSNVILDLTGSDSLGGDVLSPWRKASDDSFTNSIRSDIYRANGTIHVIDSNVVSATAYSDIGFFTTSVYSSFATRNPSFLSNNPIRTGINTLANKAMAFSYDGVQQGAILNYMSMDNVGGIDITEGNVLKGMFLTMDADEDSGLGGRTFTPSVSDGLFLSRDGRIFLNFNRAGAGAPNASNTSGYSGIFGVCSTVDTADIAVYYENQNGDPILGFQNDGTFLQQGNQIRKVNNNTFPNSDNVANTRNITIENDIIRMTGAEFDTIVHFKMDVIPANNYEYKLEIGGGQRKTNELIELVLQVSFDGGTKSPLAIANPVLNSNLESFEAYESPIDGKLVFRFAVPTHSGGVRLFFHKLLSHAGYQQGNTFKIIQVEQNEGAQI